MFIISPPAVHLGMRVRPGVPDMGRTGGVSALTAYHAHHRMTSVRKGVSLEASTASAASAAAGAIVATLARPGPTVIDAGVDPAGYPAIMDLSRGQAGRRSVPGIGRANPVKEHAQ